MGKESKILKIIAYLVIWMLMLMLCTYGDAKLKSQHKDTEPPVIQLAEKEVTVTVGNYLNTADNIVSVQDDHDGALMMTGKLSEKTASYIIDDKELDLNTAGDYIITVKAQDKAGNQSKESYTVHVIDETDMYSNAEELIEKIKTEYTDKIQQQAKIINALRKVGNDAELSKVTIEAEDVNGKKYKTTIDLKKSSKD